MIDAAGTVEHRSLLSRLRVWRRRSRVPLVRQLSAADCGAAALAMVLGHFGKHVPLEEVRAALGVGRDGTTPGAMLRVGRAYGLRGRGVRAEPEHLPLLPPGTVLFWEFRHFVVLEEATPRHVKVVDPAVGYRSIPMSVFDRAFTGVALVFEPSDGFQPAVARPRRLGRLFKQVLEARALLLRIMAMSVLVQLLSALMPLITGVLVDRVVPRQDYSLLALLAIGYGASQVFNLFSSFVRTSLLIELRTRLEARLTMQFLDHLIRLPYAYFQQHTSGDLMTRLGSNTHVREILTSTVLSTIMDGTMASIYLLLLVLSHRPLAVAAVVLACGRVALLFLLRRRQRLLLAEGLENQARSQTSQVEMLNGMEALKAMGLEHRAAEAWANVFTDGQRIALKRARLDAAFGTMQGLLGNVGTLAFMFYGSFLVLQGTLSLGTMLAVNALANAFMAPLTNLASSALQLQLLEVYLERLNDVMDTPPEQDGDARPIGALRGSIVLQDVSFRYQPQGPIVLNGVSLDIPPGRRVAVIGRTGSGKSTLARLLAGLYEPNSGRILFDGQDLKTTDRQSIRSQLGIVTQDAQLFGGSIRRNIAFSDPQMGLDRVVHAAKLACIHDDIVAMPMGYETVLADRGLSLSGGQRQRLALARAIASAPKILILDEATSHLDIVTEERVNANLSSLRCTRVVIAHRLSTIRDADEIVMLDSGGVVAKGSHDELSRTCEDYRRFVGARSATTEGPAITSETANAGQGE